MTIKEKPSLVEAACNVRKNAHAPYSGFAVGAAIMSINGQIYIGCNVENSAYGSTICAERVAITAAISAGTRDFASLVIATPGGRSPCGACRQVLSEFCDNLSIALYDVDSEKLVETSLRDLLPEPFVN